MDHIVTALLKSRNVVANSGQAAPLPLDESDLLPAGNEKGSRIVQVDSEVLRTNRIISATNNHELLDRYRILRTHVLHKMRDNNWKTLGITSPNSNAGKTLTAINLALSISMEANQTVLLVDMDLRNPAVHKKFGFTPEYGIGDYINKDVNLSDIMVRPSLERIVILPGKDPITNSSETISRPRTINLVRELKGRYQDRVIIYDLPALLSVDDAMAFMPHCDAFLLVLEDDVSKMHETMRARELLSKGNYLGSVLNKSRFV
jgi:protein-tyrosine kinase